MTPKSGNRFSDEVMHNVKRMIGAHGHAISAICGRA